MTIKVFCSGQSNALGRGTLATDWSDVSSDVRVWNNVNPLGANGTAFVTASAAQAAGTFENTDRDNAVVWLCHALANTLFDTVDLTLVARGGSAIALWDPAEVTFPMLDECVDVWTATGQGPADIFVWMHGEGDHASTPHATYMAAFADLVDNLIAAGVLSANTVILMNGIAASDADRLAFNEGVVLPITASGSRGFATSTALSTTDGTHFTGESLYALGTVRLLAAYLHATRKNVL
jgi:hypothetical protein